MLQTAIRAVIQYRKITMFTVVALAIFGMYSYYVTPKQEAPEINVPIAVITTIYPGATPEDVETLITRKIEDEISTINGYDYSESTSKEGVSAIAMRLSQDADIDKAWTDLRQKMNDLQSKLPTGAKEIQINTELSDSAGIILSVSSNQYTQQELVYYGELMKQELQKVSGISRFEIIGEQAREIQVVVDLAQLQYLPLSLKDIAASLQAQNTELPSGKIEDGTHKINVNTPPTFETIEDIGNTILLVSRENGSVVRLKDIAEIHYVQSEDDPNATHNGEQAILLAGYFKNNKNIVDVGAEIDQQLVKFQSKLPLDITVSYVLNQPKDVHKSVNQFVLNLLQGMAFVIFVVFVGMGIRNAVIVTAAIPLSILITLSAMNVLDIQIHQISITALIIGLGMLVDNAIVVSDTIQVRLDEGQERLQACIDGVREVAMPIFTSTLTTIGAFIPLLVLPSVAGEYIKSLPQIVMIALIASYVVALFVTPVMAFLFFKKSVEAERRHLIRGIFAGTLKLGMRWKTTTFVILILATVGAGLLVTTLGLQFFPKADKNIIHIDITAERTSDVQLTQSIVNQVEDILQNYTEVASYTTVVGGGLPKFYNTLPVYTASQSVAQILVEVDLHESTFKRNTHLVNELQRAVDAQVTGGTALVKELEQGEPIGAPVRLRVYGDDMDQLYEVALQIQNLLKDIDGTTNIDNDFPKKVYEFQVDVNNQQASIMGVSKYDIQREIHYALRGTEATLLKQQGNEYPIIVKGNIESLSDLEGLFIPSSITGQKFMVRDMADVKLQASVPAIRKYDREISLTIYSDVITGYSPVTIQEQLQAKLGTIEAKGVGIVFDGEREKIQENFGDIGYSALFAVLLIYGVLLLQFNSFSQPFIILLTIPLSAIGSIVGLYLFQQPLSFTAMLGIVSLFGIVVNNAIVLLDYINKEREMNIEIEQACYDAVIKRFRPIMLSTITTTMGIMPLVFSGSELFRPLAISIMCGLLVSTILTLVVVPVFYALTQGNLKGQKQQNAILSSSAEMLSK
ncbi:hypothetical protein BHU72_04190 [Desulfuribacillus stibiiarsenatis]|uniref:Transporter n=1 Tax=Desulfuribacillus stibiiarsenatis TaxID=1390249 RepID=A0A1E5L5A8_9FIRM|nr:efflux RND transporter permease subunit [Desulfuribacillus stibiiarsenatis]OEH85301.1 hypothetical protein BHU72_04190 [Desulfuribacillus stibiiarsenatis]